MQIDQRINQLYTKYNGYNSFWERIALDINNEFGTDYSSNAVRKKYQRHTKAQKKKNKMIAEVVATTRTPKPVRKSNNYETFVPFESTNVLVVGDQHEPFSVDGYAEFCHSVGKRFNCDTVVMIGDFVDQHAISFWDSDPDGMSAGLEAKEARKALQKWYTLFPDAYVCVGNHDDRIYRQAFKTGLPREYIRSMEEIWDMPDGWRVAMSFVSNDVIYEHGVTGGTHAAYNRAVKMGSSIVQGHTHITPGTQWLSNHKKSWFGLNVGCGIDSSSYSMAYGRQFSGEITLGCGVVLDNGKLPIFVPM